MESEYIWEKQYWVTFSKDKGANDWLDSEKETVQQSVDLIGRKLARERLKEDRLSYKSGDIETVRPVSAKDAYMQEFGTVDFHRLASTSCTCWGELHDEHQIYIYNDAQINSPIAGPKFIIHELAHVFDKARSFSPRNLFGYVYGNGVPRRSQSFPDYGGFAGPFEGWQQSKTVSPGEEFADMFVGWVFGVWGGGPHGTARNNWMNTNMPLWITP